MFLVKLFCGTKLRDLSSRTSSSLLFQIPTRMPSQHTSITNGVNCTVTDGIPTKTAITSWNDNPPNLYLQLDKRREDPFTLGLECTEEVDGFLHRQDTFLQPARFMRRLKSMIDEENEDYPHAETYHGGNREAREARWKDGAISRATKLVLEYNETVKTRRAQWGKEVPEGTDEMWAAYNEEEGGPILPFNFGPSILNTQRGAESRSVQSVLDFLEADRAAHRARLRAIRAAHETDASVSSDASVSAAHEADASVSSAHEADASVSTSHRKGYTNSEQD